MGKTAKKILITSIVLIASSSVLYISGSFGMLGTILLTSGLLCGVVGTPYVNGIEYPSIHKEQNLKRQAELRARRNYVNNNSKIKCKDVPADLDKTEIYLVGAEQPKQEKNCDDVLYTEEEIKQYMQVPESAAPFNREAMFETSDNGEEQTDNLQYEQSGPRLVKKR